MSSFKNDMLEAAAVQLALDMSCQPEDFLNIKNTVTLSSLLSGRRIFRNEKDFFRIATFGNGAVATVDEKIRPFAENLLGSIRGVELFDAKAVFLINRELVKFGKAIGSFNQYYLPVSPYYYPDLSGIRVKIYDEDAIPSLYGDKRFSNALMYEDKLGRHDVMAVCAMDGNSIYAIAGASNDSERFWQIGIDVLPEYRGRGTATALVSALTKEILMQGAIPYYGTWWSNIPSRNVARRAGYFPAWVEMTAVDMI